MRNFSRFIKFIILLGLLHTALALDSVKFFSSNNTGLIDSQAAFERLKGKEQDALQERIVTIMQKNHIQQGTFVDALGTYRMRVAGENQITADNTAIFIASPYQYLLKQKIFFLAKELANALKQESVAVFIPSSELKIGDVIVTFTSRQPTIDETMNLLKEKLPDFYSQGVSFYLGRTCSTFNESKVIKVEWLGSKTKLEDIKKAFPLETISYSFGAAFLVYKNGQTEPL